MTQLPSLDALETPRILLDLDRLEANLRDTQALCNQHGVQLWPHIKTHKSVEVARRQIKGGATGLTCAKIGEAEALLPSGVRRIFIAHSIVDPRNAPRLAALASQLDELILAVTSKAQAQALNSVLERAGLTLPVMQAIDTGLGREGARSEAEAHDVAATIRALPHLTLHGFYTHEGHSYGHSHNDLPALAADVTARLDAIRNAIAPELPIWPGCSATANLTIPLPGVQAVRPGAYVYGDLALCETTGVMPWERAAITVLTTVVDRPSADLALIDAGSKTFSGDKTAKGDSGATKDALGLRVVRCNEEHGYIRGEGVEELQIGDRLEVIPAHICPVLNLAEEVVVVQGGEIVAIWKVEGRGCNR